MICRYCQQIHAIDGAYPLRKATRDTEGNYPRCDWHWRYVCSICGRSRHFNGMAWCERTHNFICISCAKSHRLVQRTFWKWRTHYAVKCETCEGYHPTLDLLESHGRHPWQLHRGMQKKRTGLSRELALPKDSSIYVPMSKAEISEKKTAEAWDALAEKWVERYSEQGDLNREHVIDPAMLRMLGPVNHLSVLDAGCGCGYLSRLLAKKGAKVVGVDISKKLIKIAKQKESEKPLGVKHYVCSLSNLEMLQDETFDIAVSNLVLMDVTDLNKAMKELHRVLKKNGKLVFSIMHPCFSSPPIHGWFREPRDSQREEDWLHWKVDRYFERGMETWQLYDCPATYSFHRPLSDYMETLFANDFIITNFEEPVPSKKAIREHHRELNDSERIPWFLIIGATKQ